MATKTIAAPSLSLADRSYNHGLDHGAVVGVVASKSVASLKRGGAATYTATTNYSAGFAKGLVAGWKAA